MKWTERIKTLRDWWESRPLFPESDEPSAKEIFPLTVGAIKRDGDAEPYDRFFIDCHGEEVPDAEFNPGFYEFLADSANILHEHLIPILDELDSLRNGLTDSLVREVKDHKIMREAVLYIHEAREKKRIAEAERGIAECDLAAERERMRELEEVLPHSIDYYLEQAAIRREEDAKG